MSKIKPGMLCVVLNKNLITHELAGRFVTIVRKPLRKELFKSIDGIPCSIQPSGWEHNSWVCTSSNPLPWRSLDGKLRCFFNERVISEDILKPIEDNNGEDEMLAIAGKPPAIKLKENV